MLTIVLSQYQGESYNENRPLVVNLNRYEVLQLINTAYADITGTQVTSSRAVMLLSGMTLTNVGDIDPWTLDHVVDEIPSTSHLSKRYVVGESSSANRAPYRLKVVAVYDFTTVYSDGAAVVTLRFAGDFHELSLQGQIAFKYYHY